MSEPEQLQNAIYSRANALTKVLNDLPVTSGSPVYSNLMAPHKQDPFVVIVVQFDGVADVPLCRSIAWSYQENKRNEYARSLPTLVNLSQQH